MFRKDLKGTENNEVLDNKQVDKKERIKNNLVISFTIFTFILASSVFGYVATHNGEYKPKIDTSKQEREEKYKTNRDTTMSISFTEFDGYLKIEQTTITETLKFLEDNEVGYTIKDENNKEIEKDSIEKVESDKIIVRAYINQGFNGYTEFEFSKDKTEALEKDKEHLLRNFKYTNLTVEKPETNINIHTLKFTNLSLDKSIDEYIEQFKQDKLKRKETNEKVDTSDENVYKLNEETTEDENKKEIKTRQLVYYWYKQIADKQGTVYYIMWNEENGRIVSISGGTV